MWRDIKNDPPPLHETGFIVMNDQDIALAWFDPSMGARWAIMHIPGRGITVADTLLGWQSWALVNDFHRSLNIERNPAYYGKQ